MSAAPDAGPQGQPRLVRFRAMSPGDLPAVAAIERASYEFPWSEGIFRDCLRVGYLCRVAELEGAIIAYGVVAMGAGEAHILNLCVRGDLRGRNVGRQMLLLLLERSRQAGMEAVFLEVRPSNPHAIALYQSVGFVQVGLRKGYYQAPGGREDALCAVPKVDELHFDAVLHDSHDEDHHHLKSVAFPPPMLGLAIRAEKRGDEQKLSESLHRLVAEDPCVRVEHHTAQNETVLYGLGDLHLRVMLQRMTDRYGVAVKTSPPSVPYRETITRPAEGHHRHKKQTGGAGQFGEVYLRVEPLQRGAGFEFVDDVVGGAIPGQFIPAIEKGVRQVLTEGAIAGFELQDVRVSVYDGKHHPVDSKEVAFVSAGRKAFITAIRVAAPIVLEPIVRVAINTPAGAIGDVTSDLATRRARISGQDTLPGGRAEIQALVPLAELQDYLSRLKALTGGEGTYAMDLSHYDPVPPRRQQELVAAFKPHEESE